MSKLTSLKISVLICKKVMMVRLPRIQMRKHIKCLAERQIAGNTTYYHHFKCIHKGEKTKLHTFFIPRPLLTNTCNIYRNKCTAISANIYCCIFLSSSSFQSFCYEESLPIGGDCLPRIGWLGIPCSPLTLEVSIWPRVRKTSIPSEPQWLVGDGHVTQASLIRDFYATAIRTFAGVNR